MSIILTTQREKEILDNVIKIIKNVVNPEKIYLFGSRIKGKAFSYSDFDIGIESATPEIKKLEQLRELIDQVCGLYTIDLVFIKDVEPEFANIIKTTGIIIYER